MSPPDYTRRAKVEPEPVTVSVSHVEAATEKAILAVLKNGIKVWVPRSVVLGVALGLGQSGDLTVKPWFAQREGLK